MRVEVWEYGLPERREGDVVAGRNEVEWARALVASDAFEPSGPAEDEVLPFEADLCPLCAATSNEALPLLGSVAAIGECGPLDSSPVED